MAFIIGHSLPGRPPEDGERLRDHLLAVGSAAAVLAGAFRFDKAGDLAGRLHDIGKVAAEVQTYLRTAAAAGDGARSRGPDHSTAGARVAAERYGPLGKVLAYGIAGHHAGLADWADGLERRLDPARHAISPYPGNRSRTPTRPACRVTPRAGAWIETPVGPCRLHRALSPLAEGRGSKLRLGDDRPAQSLSPLAQGRGSKHDGAVETVLPRAAPRAAAVLHWNAAILMGVLDMRRSVALLLTCFLAVPPAGAQTLRISMGEDTGILDPTFSRTYTGRIVFAGLCDKLVDIDEKLTIVPQLALGYEWVDSTTLLMKLRPGVLFQDGEKMDAAAVKYSLERHLNMQGSFRRSEIGSMDHVEVVDPLTVRIVLKQPFAPFLAQLTDRAGMMVSPKAAEALGKDFGLHPVCAGPFKFVEQVAQDHITLDRFPDYWDAKSIHFDRVVYQPIIETTTRLANLQAGALEMANVVASDADAVKKDPKLNLVAWDWLGYNGLTANTGNGPRAQTKFGQDKRVRQAFELALDRKAIIDVVYEGLFHPTAQAVPPSSPFYAANVTPPARDPARAKALLKEAGVTLPYKLELLITNPPDAQQVGEVIQSMAAEAGFEVKLVTMESSAALAAAAAGNFEAMMIYWSGRPDPDGNIYSFVHTGGGVNDGRFSNPTIDRLSDEGRLITDPTGRRDAYQKLAEASADQLPIIYLWNPKFTWGITKKLSGFVPVPDGLIRIQGMTLAK